jgi:hypothetical protein
MMILFSNMLFRLYCHEIIPRLPRLQAGEGLDGYESENEGSSCFFGGKHSRV